MHLRASMPEVPVVTRGHMDVRIARKIAALTGIAGGPEDSDDAGRGQAWFSDYRALTTTELSLGGPVISGRHPRAGTVEAGQFRRVRSSFSPVHGGAQAEPLPSVTLQDYGPDTQAALVLTGVNRVLLPLAKVVTEVLTDLRRRVDDECLLLAVTQALLQEVFEAQPLLVQHGVQAARVQRALSLSDGVASRIDTGAGPVPLSRIEHGWSPSDTARRRPDQLSLLWDAWNAVVGDGEGGKGGAHIAFRPLSGYEQDHRFFVTSGPDARDEWVAILREVSEAHLIGAVPGLPQTAVLVLRDAERARDVAVLARERQIELMLARLAPRLVPMRPTYSPRQITLPVFDEDHWRDADVTTRRAALLAQYYCLRAAGWLAGMTELDRRRDRRTCAARYAELARAAEDLLDSDDPLRVELGVQGRTYVLQYEACRGRLDPDAYRRVVGDLDLLVAFCRAGRYPEPQLVEHLQIVLVQLGTYRSGAERFGTDDPAAVTDDLRRLWRTARSVSDHLRGGEDGADGADLSHLGHDYAGFLVNDPERGPDLVEGIRILLDEVLPARRRIADHEGRSRGLRLTRQVLLRALRSGLEAATAPEETRREWAATAIAVADDLEADRDTAALIAQRTHADPDGFDNSVLILLLRIAEGLVPALTSGLLPEPSTGRILTTDRVVARMQRYAAGPAGTAVDDDGAVDTLRVLQIHELAGCWWTWRNGQGITHPDPTDGRPT